MSYTSLSELRKSTGNFDSLMKEVDKITKPASNERKADERLWKPTSDKAGNGSAVIRFLPAPKGEDLPWVRVWSHGFQGPTGKWYIENSLTTLNLPDPVSEINSSLWNSGSDSSKDVARKQKRRTDYYANILVVKDPANPDNEGKVFLYKFGKKIFDMIKDAMQPQFDDEDPINPFDFWAGANFKLKIRKVEGYPNYDKSEFDKTTAISDNDTEIENIWNKQHSLVEFLDKKNFKSYDDLKRKLDSVLGGTATGGRPVTAERASPMDAEDEHFVSTTIKSSVKAKAPVDDGDTLSYFASLAEDE